MPATFGLAANCFALASAGASAIGTDAQPTTEAESTAATKKRFNMKTP